MSTKPNHFCIICGVKLNEKDKVPFCQEHESERPELDNIAMEIQKNIHDQAKRMHGFYRGD